MEGALRASPTASIRTRRTSTPSRCKSVEQRRGAARRRRRHRADAPVLPARDRRARRLASGQGRAADRRLRPRHRHQADPRHVGVRGYAPAARCAGNQGHADGHSRQRGRAARRRPGAREGGGRGGHLAADRHGRRLPARRHVQERLGRGDQEAGGRPGEVRGEVAADRSAADGGRSVRQRHRRRAAVRQVRHAGDQGRPRQSGSHAGRGARQ